MNVADPPYTIEFATEAGREIRAMPEVDAWKVLKDIHTHLSTAPFKGSTTRIKRLVSFSPLLYRLRIGDYRTYYRIVTNQVVILTVLHKKDSERWLKPRGEKSADANRVNPAIRQPSVHEPIVQGDNLVARKALLPYYPGHVKCLHRSSIQHRKRELDL